MTKTRKTNVTCCDFRAVIPHRVLTHKKAVHFSIKEYLCDQCDHKSSTKFSLKVHKRGVHEKIKDHGCSMCNFKAGSAQEVKEHTKAVHDKIRDNACNQCNYRSSNRSKVHRHKRAVHDKIKNHKCDLCSFKSSWPKTIKMHLKSVHDKVKDQHCDLCDFKASQSRELRRHQKTVHFRIKDYECDQCDYKSSCKSTLIEHKRSKHPYTSRSREEVKPALQKTTNSSIFDEISEEFDEISEDQESNDIDPMMSTHSVTNLSDSNSIVKAIKLEDIEDQTHETVTTSNITDVTIHDQVKNNESCCLELKSQNSILLGENARLIRELAVARERYQAERRQREELEDNLFIMQSSEENLVVSKGQK